MKKYAVVGCVAALAVGIAARAAQDDHPMPKPLKDHEWLKQLVGEWTSEVEIAGHGDKPAQKFKGAESGRMIGGFWAMLENKGEFMGAPFTGILTLGFDAEKKKYVGTWIDSMSHFLWRYEGTVDASGKTLTLETEGPSHEEPGKTVKYKEITEIKSPDHKVFTSTCEKDGKWVTLMTIHYHRNKK
ncbi:MAG: DUF1579 domain-containing protein [Planctomycetes bacterium]|nr:DUF1579 domain-containing protein [Planctomycetota bacterium]